MAGLNLAQVDEDLGATLPYEGQVHFRFITWVSKGWERLLKEAPWIKVEVCS